MVNASPPSGPFPLLLTNVLPFYFVWPGILSSSVRMSHHAVLAEGPLHVGGYNHALSPPGSLFKLNMYDFALVHADVIQEMCGGILPPLSIPGIYRIRKKILCILSTRYNRIL